MQEAMTGRLVRLTASPLISEALWTAPMKSYKMAALIDPKRWSA